MTANKGQLGMQITSDHTMQIRQEFRSHCKTRGSGERSQIESTSDCGLGSVDTVLAESNHPQ